MNDAGALDLLRQYVPEGGAGLAFDIGSHAGDHARVLAQLVDQVVAVEPQAGLTPPIAGVTQLWAAATARPGVFPMFVDHEHPYLTTLSVDYPDKVRQHSSEYVFDPEPVYVAGVTLDQLVEVFGVPAFVKIDVEGHELSVLEGLTEPLPALSFEVHDFDEAKALSCVERLDELGVYQFAYSRRESFALEPWPPADGLDIFGDVYARRIDP